MKRGQKTYENVEDVEMVLKTKKQSQSGIFNNERLLFIKAGVVSYFSQIPKKFTGSAKSIQFAGQLPKYTILASNIDHMDLKTGSLTILFKKQKLISKSQFNNLVTSIEQIPEPSQKSAKSDSNYVKWIFLCEDDQKMRQFYRLINLFRTSNAKFKPSLGSYVSGFQTKKNVGRQMSMAANKTSQIYQPNNRMQGRMSQTPVLNNDFKLDQFLKVKKQPPKQEPKIIEPEVKQQQIQTKTQIQIKPPSQPVPIQVKIEQPIKNQPLDQNRQKSRLNQVKQKIQTMNYPQLGIIDQKQNQDKQSQMSRNHLFQIFRKSSEVINIILNDEDDQLNQDDHVKLDESLLRSHLRQSFQQKKQDDPHKEDLLTIKEQPLIVKQKSFQVLQDSIQEQDEQDSSSQKTSQQSPSQQQNSHNTQGNFNISQTFNQTNNSNSSIYSHNHQQSSLKQKKLKQFIKAYHYSFGDNLQQVCLQLKITTKEYESLIKQYLNQDLQYWPYIQSTLTKLLAQQTNIQVKISLNLIEQQHKIYKNIDNQSNYNDKKLLSHHEISFDAYQHSNQQEKQALQFISAKMTQENRSSFQTKIFNQSMFKVHIKGIQYKKEKIIYMENGWIINVGSCLEQFLACLRLEKIVGQLGKTNSKNIKLKCSETYYLKYKDYQGIAKQIRVGNNFLPFKSIKFLQFIAKSKEIIQFQQHFPQFTIIIECLKNNKQFRFHLDRISEIYNPDPLIRQLKKITFSYNNQIDIFCQSKQYNNFVDFCLNQLDNLKQKKEVINRQGLEIILQKINHNITVNILFKMLNCRMDNKGNIYFHHSVLKLGGRQFGQQLQFINRSKKKGNNPLSIHLSKRVISKLQYYRHVTPISNFIQIYLQMIDLMIVQQGQLHKAIPILHKISSYLSQYELQQYSIYLNLMKIYLKLNQINNFIKIMQNCRLFIDNTFKQYSLILNYPFKRIINIFLLRENINKALDYNDLIIKEINDDKFLPQRQKIKYKCKCVWDRCNMLISLDRFGQAYRQCQQALKLLEEQESNYQDIWNQGVICLGKCWMMLEEINSINASNLQKRIAQALELSFYRQNLQMTFIIYEIGQKILQRCIKNKLPKILQFFPSFQRAKILYKQSHAYFKEIIIQKH